MRFAQALAQSLLVVRLLVDQCKVPVGDGYALFAAKLLVERERLALHLLGPGKIAARLMDDAEIAVGGGHALLAAYCLVECERVVLHLLSFVEFAAAFVN